MWWQLAAHPALSGAGGHLWDRPRVQRADVPCPAHLITITKTKNPNPLQTARRLPRLQWDSRQSTEIQLPRERTQHHPLYLPRPPQTEKLHQPGVTIPGSVTTVTMRPDGSSGLAPT